MSCGVGTRYSYRYCDNPAPNEFGMDCVGDSMKYEDCDMGRCLPTRPPPEYGDTGAGTDIFLTGTGWFIQYVPMFCRLCGFSAEVIQLAY